MSSSPEVFLLHDGELADVAVLLRELDVEWAEGRSGRVVSGTPPLVIGTPVHLLRWNHGGAPGFVARIALCGEVGRTLERKLEAQGVDFVLRRPIHPAALRLLILHLIYRGPERRRLRRVSAALPLRYRAGWRVRRGLLLEFSVSGCSLLAGTAEPAGRRIKVTLPSEVGLGRKLVVKGRVVRTVPAPVGAADEHVIAVDFGDLSPDAHQRLAAAVVARARQIAAVEVASPAEVEPRTHAVRPETELRDRRQHPRAVYTKAVHGRAGDRRVVLMGSNLSPRGMQVDPDPQLTVGSQIKLDLYGHGDIPPLRIEARVARDDGERGLFLEFENLWPGAPALLERVIKKLPLVNPGDGRGLVISELIESR